MKKVKIFFTALLLITCIVLVFIKLFPLSGVDHPGNIGKREHLHDGFEPYESTKTKEDEVVLSNNRQLNEMSSKENMHESSDLKTGESTDDFIEVASNYIEGYVSIPDTVVPAVEDSEGLVVVTWPVENPKSSPLILGDDFIFRVTIDKNTKKVISGEAPR